MIQSRLYSDFPFFPILLVDSFGLTLMVGVRIQLTAAHIIAALAQEIPKVGMACCGFGTKNHGKFSNDTLMSILMGYRINKNKNT